MNPERGSPLRTALPLVLRGVLAAGLVSGCSGPGADPALYTARCAPCHGGDGKGLRALYPPLQGSPYLDEALAKLPCLIAGGSRAVNPAGEKATRPRMPAFPDLSTAELTVLIGYLRQQWGRPGEAVTEEAVATWLHHCP